MVIRLYSQHHCTTTVSVLGTNILRQVRRQVPSRHYGSPREVRGDRNVGNAMTFKILTAEGKIIHRSVVRSATSNRAFTNRRADAMADETVTSKEPHIPDPISPKQQVIGVLEPALVTTAISGNASAGRNAKSNRQYDSVAWKIARCASRDAIEVKDHKQTILIQ